MVLRISHAFLACILIGEIVGVVSATRAEEAIKREFQECSECPTMVGIPAGKFVMGSPPTERGRFDAEGPQHVVSVSAFALGKYEVTTAEFLSFLRETGYQPAPCNPILGLTWKTVRRG